MRPAVAAYLLLTGVALGLALYVWHVWSDNAYLFVYLGALILLVAGTVVGTVAAGRVRGIAPAIGAVAAALGVAVALVGPIGATRPLAEAFVGGGNGSQSPCVAEFQREHADEIARHQAEMRELERSRGIVPPSPDEVRAGETAGIRGGLSQVVVPFIAGAATLATALRRSPARDLGPAVAAAAIVVAYVYVRGPAAWCGQIYGIDGLAAVVAGLVVVARRRSAVR